MMTRPILLSCRTTVHCCSKGHYIVCLQNNVRDYLVYVCLFVVAFCLFDCFVISLDVCFRCTILFLYAYTCSYNIVITYSILSYITISHLLITFSCIVHGYSFIIILYVYIYIYIYIYILYHII